MTNKATHHPFPAYQHPSHGAPPASEEGTPSIGYVLLMWTGDAGIEVDRPNMKYDNYEKLAGRVREFRLEYRDLSDHELVKTDFAEN